MTEFPEFVQNLSSVAHYTSRSCLRLSKFS